VTACENDLDAERMKRREVEAALAKLTQRNDELRSTLKAYLATIKRLEAKVADREASKAEAEAALAERDRMLDVAYADYAEEWHDGDPQFVQHDRWLADLRARAEEGRE
jgi:septal ring factor EnvC (AmiA/AmiB activator)